MKNDTRTPDELYAAGEEVIGCPRCGAKSSLIAESQPGEPEGGTYICGRCCHVTVTGDESRKQLWNAVLVARGKKPDA